MSLVRSVLAFSFVATLLFAAHPTAPTGLIIEIANNVDHLIMVDDDFPEFGWIMNDADVNEYQSAYQVLIASSQDILNQDRGDIWNSDKVNSHESTNVEYGANARALQHGKMYFWKVRLWDKDGNGSPYSETARFVKSLSINDWVAKPIWDNSNRINEDVCDYTFLRKQFELPSGDLQYAIAFITSRDARIQKSPAYKFFINEQLVSIGPFQGFQDRISYQAIDVTDHLKTEESNVLAAICESTVKDRSFLLQLYLQYDDGDTTIVTDRSWKSYNAQSIYNPGGSKTSNAYHYVDPFENIDSRKIPQGWMEVNYDNSGWANAREHHPYYDKLMAVSKPPFEIEVIEPKLITHRGNGDYDIALGSGYFGYLRLEFDQAQPGDTIEIRGEQDIYPWTVVDWVKWIIGDPVQTIEEFGYVWTDSLQIRAYDGDGVLDESNIKFVAIRNPFDDERSSFNSSDPLLDEIYAFCKRSMKNLNVDFYWDTPQNERLAYEGGALIQQLSSYTVDREYALARFACEYQYNEPTWPAEYRMQNVMLAWHDFMYTGNVESLHQYWDILKQKRYLVDASTDYLVTNVSAHALDWPPIYQDGYDYTSENHEDHFADNVLNAWNYYAVDKLALIAEHLDSHYPREGFRAEKRRFNKLARSIKKGYNRSFFNRTTGKYVDGKHSLHSAFHSSFYPVSLGLVQEDQLPTLSKYLHSRNMDCGVFASQFFLDALYDLNFGDKALDHLLSREKNSWYHVIYEMKAANTTEAWDASGKPDMSKSHAWGGAAGNIIQQGLMGITPIDPGFNKISIKPQIGSLEHASIRFPTIKGSVIVKVISSSDYYELEVNIPANTTAIVSVPMFNNASKAIQLDGVLVQGKLDGSGQFIQYDGLGSGPHVIRRTKQ